MNLVERSIEYVQTHPHFLRGYSGPKLDIRDNFNTAWMNGLVNMIFDNDQEKLVGIFMAVVIKEENLQYFKELYPDIDKCEAPVLILPMIHILPGEKISMRYLYKMLYKVAEIDGCKSTFVIDGKRRFKYTFDKRTYEDNEYKYLITNKNMSFEV